MASSISARWTAAALAATLAAAQAAEAVASPAADDSIVVAGANALGVDLYKALAGRDGNLVFSPANISIAFAMAYSAARGQTAQEMAKALHVSLPVLRNDAAAGRLFKSLQINRDDVQLRSANAVWLNAIFPLRPEFQNTLSANYGAAPRRLDVSGDGEAGRAQINGWVKEQTAGKITNLIPPGQIKSGTTLVLTSATYLKARWAHPFPADTTTTDAFHGPKKGSVPVPFMRDQLDARYAVSSRVQAVELPYQGDELSMVILLPRSRDGLARFERGLNARELAGLLSQVHGAKSTWIDLSLPKFIVDDAFPMKELLGVLGMKRAFTCEAQFAMTVEPSAISEARHKAFLAVDETGAEAAAATAIESVVITSSRIRPPPVPFKADHPFAFVVRDNRSGSILFMGRFAGPGQEARSTDSGPPLSC